MSGAKVILITLTVLAIGYGKLAAFSTLKYEPNNPGGQCQFKEDSLLAKVLAFFRIGTDAVIPFLMILTTNIILIINVLKSQENLNSISEAASSTCSTASTEASTPDELTPKMITKRKKPAMIDTMNPMARKSLIAKPRAQRQLAIMLIFTTLAFIILNLPYICLRPISILYNYRQSLTAFVNYMLARQCTNLLLAANASINIFVYLATGTKFRQDFKTLFAGIFRRS